MARLIPTRDTSDVHRILQLAQIAEHDMAQRQGLSLPEDCERVLYDLDQIQKDAADLARRIRNRKEN